MAHGVFNQGPKEKKKILKDLNDSIEEENKLNANRKGKTKVTVMIKDGRRWFAPNDQLRDKFFHAPDLDSPIPGRLDLEHTRSLPYRERLEYILPEVYIEQYRRDLRFHILSPDTKVIPGTLGANREANGGPPKIEGFHLFNDKTGVDALFDKNSRKFRTLMEANPGQQYDIENNGKIS